MTMNILYHHLGISLQKLGGSETKVIVGRNRWRTSKLSVKLPVSISTAELRCGDSDASSRQSVLLTGSALSVTTFLTPSNANNGRRKREGSSHGIDVDEEQEPESVPTKSKVCYNLNT